MASKKEEREPRPVFWGENARGLTQDEEQLWHESSAVEGLAASPESRRSSWRRARRSGSSHGIGRRRTDRTMLNIALFAPMPMARIAIALRAKAGSRASARRAMEERLPR